MLTKTLNLVPVHDIQSGSVNYSIDPVSGTIQWSSKAVVTPIFFPIYLSKSGVLKVDPSLLLSSNVTLGKVVEFGSVKLTVQSIDRKAGIAVAIVEVTTPDVSETGTAHFDISSEYIQLMGLQADGKIEGISQPVQLVGA